MGWSAAVGIALDAAERGELERRARRRKTSRGDALRAEIVLLAADGMTDVAVAERLGASRLTVATWRKRFAAHRLADEAVPERRARSAMGRSPRW